MKNKIKLILQKIVAWYGYITKSTIQAINTFIWLNVGVFALTNLVGEMSILTITWNGWIFIGLLCYEFFQRRWLIMREDE